MTKRANSYVAGLKDLIAAHIQNPSIIKEPSAEKSAYDEFAEKRNLAILEARLKEKQRIAEIPCPLCKSTDKHHQISSSSNGICGPGHYSRIDDEYFICKSCGVMYKDLHKLRDQW
jgi:hypothetical protein